MNTFEASGRGITSPDEIMELAFSFQWSRVFLTGYELGREFDLVFLPAIIHGNSYDENRNLIRKASKALNPRGQVVIQDFIMDEDRTAPAFGTLFSLTPINGISAFTK